MASKKAMEIADSALLQIVAHGSDSPGDKATWNRIKREIAALIDEGVLNLTVSSTLYLEWVAAYQKANLGADDILLVESATPKQLSAALAPWKEEG